MKSQYAQSLALWNRAAETLVRGTTTISKHPSLATLGAYPIYARSADGAELSDIDGNRYLDFGSALGAVLLGYNEPRVIEAVQRELSNGILFSLSSALTVELSSHIVDLVPSVERVRFTKSGSDATTAAARIARAYTGRKKIAVCNYHGWHDWCYVGTPLAEGIPPSFQSELLRFNYNSFSDIERLLAAYGPQIAAFILEPTHLEEPKPGYLSFIRDMAHTNGSLLIFDEVVTGFRFEKGGAQEFFDVTPDITCMAKALGNGFPIAAVGGAADVMDSTSRVITSTTYGEETLSISAAIATLEVLSYEPVHQQLWERGSALKDGFNALSRRYNIPIECLGYPVRMDLCFESSTAAERKLLKSFFLQETARRGVLFAGHLFVNYSHTITHIERALSVCEEVFALIQKHGTITKNMLSGALTEELW